MKETNNKSVEPADIPKSPWYYSGFMKKVYLILIPVIAAAILGHCFWLQQFENIKKQTLLEYKISSLDQFTKIAYKRLYLSEFELKIDIEKYIEAVKVKENYKKNTGKVLEKLSSEQEYTIHMLVKEKYPIVYENYMKCLELQNEYSAASTSVTILFSKSIADETNELTTSFSQNVIFSSMDKALSAKQFGDYNIDKKIIIDNIQLPRFEHLKTLLNNMIIEIKGEQQQ